MPKATRSSHTKSRGGCLRCKKRHVKCDEQRPCGNCVRRHAECSLAISPATSLLLGRPLTPQDSPSSDARRTSVSVPRGPTPGEVERHAQPSAPLSQDKAANIRKLLKDLTNELETLTTEQSHQVPTQPVQPTPDPVVAPARPTDLISPDDWLQDLQLLQFYCSSAYRNLCSSDDEATIWGDTLPQMAFSNKALMHGVLALSALLYGHDNPDEREAYMIASTRHQSIAISAFSEQLHSINEENCPAAFLLAALIFAMKTFSICEQYEQGIPVAMSDITHAFLLSQGTRTILASRPTWKWPEERPLDIFFQPADPDVVPTGPYMQRLATLLALARRIVHGPASIDQRSALVLAVEALRHVYTAVRAPGRRPGRVWSWGVVVPAAFLGLAERGDAGALAVLAHFVALVHAGEGRRWHVRGWAMGVMDAVVRGLEAGRGAGGEWRAEWAEWERVAMWPVRCVREWIDVRSVEEEGYVEGGGAAAAAAAE